MPHHPAIQPAAPAEPSPAWTTLAPGLRQLHPKPGPAFQLIDAINFEWNTYELTIPHLPQNLTGLRIIHLSDLHARQNWQRAYDHLAARLSQNVPDLILFTGDAIDDKKRPHKALPIAKKFFEQLPARLGVFGIRGNHDLNLLPADFARTPLNLIDGERLLINAAPKNQSPAQIELIAIPGPLRDNLTHNWFQSLPKKTEGIPRIILSHYPDHIIRMQWTNPDIYLAGHTHGGQMCLPTGIPLIRHDSLPRHLCKGAHQAFNTHFIVNKGFGFSSLPLRTFCPAEVIELRLLPSPV